MSMVLAVMYREYRIRTTSLTWTFYDLFMPLTYLLLFGIGLDKAFSGGISTQGIVLSYNTFFLAGVLSMASFGIAINTSYGFFVDRDNGIFYEFLTYPMTRGEFLVGKIVFNCVLSIVQTIITISLGAALLGIPLQPERMGLVLIGVVIGTAGWFFFLTTFALRIRRNDMFNTFINVAYFVLMFASSIFYPLDALPSWLKVAAQINPLTWHTDVLRFATVGLGALDVVMIEAAAFGVFMLVSFWFAVRTLQNAILK
ncbi:MAG: ABC transporter permease [Ignavibacteriae bacterium]|nr:ABC transporter permease [Ignavibacteriota bacterium]